MQTISSFKKLTWFLIFIVTISFVYWLNGAPSPRLLAAESTLAQPWPTLVVTYLAQPPVEPPARRPAPQVAQVSFLFHSPLPPPTPIPDTLLPTTAVQVSGEQGDEAWYRSSVSLTFALSDDFGASYTEYKFDNAAAWNEREYYYPAVVLAEEGVHTPEYRSLDTVRNAEAPQSAQIRVDRTPPQANEPVLDGNPLPNGWYNQPISIQFSGADALSGTAIDAETGVFQTQAQLQSQASPAIYQAPLRLDQEGRHTLTWFSLDRALNQETPQSQTLLLDLMPPTLTYNLTGDAVVDGWYRSAATLEILASDGLAGVAQVEYALDGGPWQTYSTPLVIDAAGAHRVSLRAQDLAGNLSAASLVQVGIDRQPPHSSVALTGGRAANGWYVTPVTVTQKIVVTGRGVYFPAIIGNQVYLPVVSRSE